MPEAGIQGLASLLSDADSPTGSTWAAVALSELAAHTDLQETVARVALPAVVALLQVRPESVARR